MLIVFLNKFSTLTFQFVDLKMFRLNNGQRVLCTMIHFPENHVIQLQDPNLWFIRNPTGKRRAFGVYGPRWNVSLWDLH